MTHTTDIQNNDFSIFIESLRGHRLLHLGHKGTDCDSLGSAYALSRVLPGDIGFAHDMKATAYELATWLGIEPLIDPDPGEYEHVIIYDTYTPDLLGVPIPQSFSIFDHHIGGGRPYVDRPNQLASEAEWSWVWPVEATCSILTDLFLAHHIPIDRKMAVAMAAGIITDTSMLKVAHSAAFKRLAALLEPHELYYSDVIDAIDPSDRSIERRSAVVAALQCLGEKRVGPWSILATYTDSHDHGFAVLSALNRLCDVGIVSFPKGENAMAMVECTPSLAARTGIDLGKLTSQIAALANAEEAWGIPTGGRIIARASAQELLQLCTQALVQALNNNHSGD